MVTRAKIPVKHTRQILSGMFGIERNDFCKTLISVISVFSIYTQVGTSPNDITIVPTKPTTTADLPNNTKVTITYGSDSVVYTYAQATGTFTTTSATPIKILGVAAGASINYGVEVDLPVDTKLSTDIGKGFLVPITAFIDSNTIRWV